MFYYTYSNVPRDDYGQRRFGEGIDDAPMDWSENEDKKSGRIRCSDELENSKLSIDLGGKEYWDDHDQGLRDEYVEKLAALKVIDDAHQASIDLSIKNGVYEHLTRAPLKDEYTYMEIARAKGYDDKAVLIAVKSIIDAGDLPRAITFS